jgi:hypothetical protein
MVQILLELQVVAAEVTQTVRLTLAVEVLLETTTLAEQKTVVPASS